MKIIHPSLETKLSAIFSKLLPGRTSKNIPLLLICFFTMAASAQVKIGSNPNTINPNSILELESTNKGFLPPRVALDNTNSVSPLTGTVPDGMLVYSTGGELPDGFYYWNGSAWKLLAISELNLVTKTASTTLTKAETMVLASNDITLTLPAITPSDDGLAITIKNIGSYADLVVVKGTSNATIDGEDSLRLTRIYGQTLVAAGGNWIIKNKSTKTNNVMDVVPGSSWATLEEALEFLDKHMTGPTVLRLSSETYDISETIVIDLPFSLTIEGASYGSSTIQPASGLGGKPLFKCYSEAYFKKLAFDGTSLASYGNSAGEDAIHLDEAGEYYEIKDCSFNQFYKAVVLKSNVELWMFEVDVKNAGTGIEIAANTTNGVSLKISEVDFIDCGTGVNMLSGNNAVVSILNSAFYNAAGGTGVNYVPNTFTDISSMFITNNAWNNVGTFFNGFDFSNSRDSKAFLQSNAGDPDRHPRCHINVLNSATSVPLTNPGWYRASWSSAATTVSTIKWTVDNIPGSVNKIIYQPMNKKDGYFIISGNLSCTANNQTISIGIVKNGNTSIRYGETTMRTGNSGTPILFSTTVYLSNISQDDYFELYLNGSYTNITIHDLQWFADTK